ncbi:WbqC family protein [Hymenobacter sp. GOD-10R]|uniref:WbqC family protein n=1 Tax=Hymenobacter sp. GOD-10R TaxID=3093922 RepID=UPI002D7A3FFB|nr:WbqC family protein [Hymenobacter sp. GOD-10R]WRQ27360.1 WbqC family protein [Hymenobacter sp. GOD-10R]
MQPYLFPYLGYFQLLHCADTFVLLDDVAFINKGWINRNVLLVNCAKYLFSIPLLGSSQNKLIKDIRLYPDIRPRQKLLATIRQEYKTAIAFNDVFPLVEQILLSGEGDLTALVLESLRRINAHVNLSVPVLRSSTITKDNGLVAQARIIEICQRLGAHEYVNLPGGAALYAAADFERQGIRLRFLQPALIPYSQRGQPFVPGLSIIDVLMHNRPNQVQQFFQQATLQ